MFYPKKLIVPVFVCAVLAGVGLHFLYARFPCTLSALLSPVCESLWEHIKILYWPYLGGIRLPRLGASHRDAPLAAVPCHPVSPDAGPGPAAPCGARPPRPVAGHRPVSGADGLRILVPCPLLRSLPGLAVAHPRNPGFPSGGADPPVHLFPACRGALCRPVLIFGMTFGGRCGKIPLRR